MFTSTTYKSKKKPFMVNWKLLANDFGGDLRRYIQYVYNVVVLRIWQFVTQFRCKLKSLIDQVT